MRDFNKAIIMGNLTRDPEMRFTPNGKAVCSYAVATNRRWNDASGNMQESTEFHDIVAWGKLAEISDQILYKGRKVLIEGRLQTRSWEGQDGVKRNKTEIVVENLSAIGPAGGKSTSSAQPKQETDLEEVIDRVDKKPDKKDPENKTNDKKPNSSSKDEEIDLDDIPF